MTEKEHFFWNKLLELAKEELTQATFDYYVLDTKLIKVQNNVATILLEEVKKLFWEKNMQSFILMVLKPIIVKSKLSTSLTKHS